VRCSSFARRSALAVGAVLAVLTLGACQVSTTVGVDARADGSGVVRATVTLDKDAAGQVPDLRTQLRVDDLRSAGWRVEGPTPTKDGGAVLSASKGFASPAEATTVVEQLSGPTGPFRAFTLRRSRSFAKTRVSFRGHVDLSKGLAAFSDSELRTRLGSDLGFDPEALQGRLGRSLARIFPVTVAVRLPGSVESNAPLRAGNGARWSPTFGESVALTATSEQWNTRNLAAAGLAVLAGLALLALLAAPALPRPARPAVPAAPATTGRTGRATSGPVPTAPATTDRATTGPVPAAPAPPNEPAPPHGGPEPPPGDSA
jgi:hypothetical protein